MSRRWLTFGLRRCPDEATCAEAMRAMQAWLDGLVAEPQQTRVRRHLETCRRCGLEADTYREIRASLRSRGTRVDPAAHQRLRAYVDELTTGLEPMR